MNFFLKNKREFISIFVFGLMSSATALAHDGRQPDFERLANKLELSEPQATEFVQVMQEQREKRQEMRKAVREEKMELLKKYHEETLAALSSVLDEEQLLEFKEHAEKRREKIMAKKRLHRHAQ